MVASTRAVVAAAVVFGLRKRRAAAVRTGGPASRSVGQYLHLDGTPSEALRLRMLRQVHINLASSNRATRVADRVISGILAGLHTDARAHWEHGGIGRDNALLWNRARGRAPATGVCGRRERCPRTSWQRLRGRHAPQRMCAAQETYR